MSNLGLLSTQEVNEMCPEEMVELNELVELPVVQMVELSGADCVLIRQTLGFTFNIHKMSLCVAGVFPKSFVVENRGNRANTVLCGSIWMHIHGRSCCINRCNSKVHRLESNRICQVRPCTIASRRLQTYTTFGATIFVPYCCRCHRWEQLIF